MIEWFYLVKDGIDKKLVRELMRKYKKVSDIFDDEFYVVFNKENIQKIEKALQNKKEKEVEKLQKEGINILSINDERYPEKLKKIVNPPLFLYYKGDISLLNNKNLGVVGTRNSTKYGKYFCSNILKDLKGYNINIVSGMARGIDRIAHIEAMKNDLPTIAVIGSGFQNIYPKSNIDIFYEISQKGLVISEYPVDFTATNWSFPMRNRIIAGLSDSLFVVETYKSGGSLITAEQCFDNNREIYTIPGFLNYKSFEGNNLLIKYNKAKLITRGLDIVEDMNLLKGGR